MSPLSWSLTRSQNSVHQNMLSRFRYLRTRAWTGARKRRALHHRNLKRMPATESCSRNSDEMVGKGQSTQAKSSPTAICAFRFNLLHSEGVGLHLATGRAPSMLETKAMGRVYLETTEKPTTFFCFLAACLSLLWAPGALVSSLPFPSEHFDLLSVPTQGPFPAEAFLRRPSHSFLLWEPIMEASPLSC